jgi:hypothetical protein
MLAEGNENATHSLATLDKSYVPELIEAYWRSDNIHLRLALLTVISNYRHIDTLSFFVAAFHDSHEAIWQGALNGFFVNEGTLALDALGKLKTGYSVDQGKSKVRLSWLDEAIQQIQQSIDQQKVGQ